MFSLQSHNQVLYHLSQLTSAVSPKRTKVVFPRRKNVDSSFSKDIPCQESFNEALKNFSESPWRDSYKEVKNGFELWSEVSNQRVGRRLKKILLNSKVAQVDDHLVFYHKKKAVSTLLSNSVLSSKLVQHAFLNPHKPFELGISVRHFKTDRSVKAEEARNPSVIQRIKLMLGFDARTSSQSSTSTHTNVAAPMEVEAPTLKQLFGDEKTTPEELQRMKVAFAEGYLAGQNQKSMTKSAKWLKIVQQLLTVLLFLSIFVSLMASANGSMFRIQLGNQVEVDPEEIHVTFNDVKGADEAKQELKDVVEFLRSPEKFSALGGKLPKGVLLVGPPGTGKTLLARAVAGEAGVPFFHAAGPEFDEILVGQGARRVRDLFKAAKDRAPCVIFIDEIDSVGAKRTNSVLHPYANQTINQLLSEMDGFHQNDGVIVLGATNRRDDLDKALLRPGRFDVEVNVPTPDLTGRKEILALYLGRVLTKGIDVDLLARGTTGFTGADLENMVNQAALKAAIDGADCVTMKYLESARDKVIMGPERKSRIPDEEANEITAYHEGGHAIVAYYTKDSHPLHKVTIIPRGPSLGHTAYMPEKESYHVTKKQLLAMMDTMMGGRAAEELIFGADKITSGASNDLKQATSIATAMVKDWGMSETVGLRTYDSTGKSYIAVNELAPGTSEAIDGEIKRLLQESYERAKSILKTHQKEHRALAEALLKYETLDADDIKGVISGKPSAGSDKLNA